MKSEQYDVTSPPGIEPEKGRIGKSIETILGVSALTIAIVPYLCIVAGNRVAQELKRVYFTLRGHGVEKVDHNDDSLAYYRKVN